MPRFIFLLEALGESSIIMNAAAPAANAAKKNALLQDKSLDKSPPIKASLNEIFYGGLLFFVDFFFYASRLEKRQFSLLDVKYLAGLRIFPFIPFIPSCFKDAKASDLNCLAF